MIADKNQLINGTAKAAMPEIMIANKTRIPVSCSGYVLITVVGKRTYAIKVNNVLCVPELGTNLLSVS